MILVILLFILCITGIIYFTRENKARKQQEETFRQKQVLASINSSKLNQKKEDIQNYYAWLKNKDIVLYHELYAKTLELLKSEEHEDFFIVFDKFFQETNKELFDDFKGRK